MATVCGILVKQFGGPEVLEYVTNIVQPLKPAARQVFHLYICCLDDFACLYLLLFVHFLHFTYRVKESRNMIQLLVTDIFKIFKVLFPVLS